MSKFHSLRVKELCKETTDCTSIVLEVPERLQGDFEFIQGQYLTFKKDINGEDIRRSYSLCSSPMEGEWRVAVKQVEGGRFSTFANTELQVGDTLDVMPPQGKFYTELKENQNKNYVAFAAGSGITPILSIIKTSLAKETQSSFQLFYLNKNFNSIIFKEELEALKNQYLDRFSIFHFFTRQKLESSIFNGRFHQEKLSKLSKSLLNISNVNDYFLCGPAEMIFGIKDYLLDNGVAKENIHFELFNTDGLKISKGKVNGKKQLNGKMSHIQLVEDGKSIQFDLQQGTENILDAALKQGADLPFACKGGVCCTCKAKLVEGKVEMPVNYGLEPDEIEAGYILTCQAYPLTEKLTVDFTS